MKRFLLAPVVLAALFLLSACSFSDVRKTAAAAYANYPGGTYTYTAPDGRLVTVTVSGPRSSDGKTTAQ